jgi:hypothetical protein
MNFVVYYKFLFRVAADLDIKPPPLPILGWSRFTIFSSVGEWRPAEIMLSETSRVHGRGNNLLSNIKISGGGCLTHARKVP